MIAIFQEDFLESFRSIFVLLWVWSILPGIFATGSNLALEKIEFEFKAFRLQQYEYGDKLFGSKSWKILYEAVSLNETALRRCVVVHWRDLIGKDTFLTTHVSVPVGALLVVIPEKLDALPPNEKQNFIALEQQFSTLKTEAAIYFAPVSPLLKSLLKNVALTSSKASTAFQQIINSFSADNYQLSTLNTATTNNAVLKSYNIIGQLNSADRGNPYIFIVAHYDTHSIIPALAYGADSNGSGVAVLLEILRILSRLFSNLQNAPKYNVVFALTTGGKFSYQGSRSFIDDFNEKHADDNVELAICLDGLGRGNIIYSHVSKALNEGNPSYNFVQHLKNFAEKRNPIDVVAKKISLSSDKLAWEHEIFNIRRIHALTLSHFSNHSDPLRNSLLDVLVNVDIVKRNTELIVNALTSYVFGLDSALCEDSQKNGVKCSMVNVNRERLQAYLDVFASKPRMIGMPMTKLLADMHDVVRRYAHHSQISEVTINDYVIYDIFESKISVSVVKPAIFDLFIASGVIVYLFGVYHLANHAHTILSKKLF